MSRRRRTLGDLATGLAFLAPNFLGFAVFLAGPVLFSLVMSFSNWNLLRTIPLQWTGLENYAALLADRKFWLYLINTFYLMLGMPLAIFGSLFLAIQLSKPLRGVVVWRTLLYLPTFTAGVALLLLWKTLYNPEFGPINTALEWVGIQGPQWLTSVQNLLGLQVERAGLSRSLLGLGARDALIIMGLWLGVGGTNMLLYIAAISNIPPQLYEAAEIDGAGGWASFWHVTWPQLAPTTFYIVVMSFIGGLQGGFETARVMTGGGPAGTTTTLSYYIYTKAFEEFQMGYASAISWVLFALIFGITLLNWKFGSQNLNE